MGMNIDTEKLQAGLASYFETSEALDLIKAIKANPGAAFATGKVTDFIRLAVRVVEDLGRDLASLEGGDKKEVLVDWLDSVIELPFFLEWFDGKVIAMIIDYAVEWFNAKFADHTWPTVEEVPEPITSLVA